MSYDERYLAHHGIKGQKCGIRRFQNEDGSLTAAGRRHLERQEIKESKKKAKEYEKAINKQQDTTRRLTGAGANYVFERNVSRKRSEDYLSRANFTKSDRKREKYMRKAQEFAKYAEINDKKARQVLKDLTYEEKKTKALIEKMKNDKTVTYRTVYGDSYASASKDYRKGLDDKYGKAKYAGSYQATTVTGTNYKVRGANTRAGRSRKYNDSKYKQDRDVQLVRQQYYYY